MLIFGQKVFNFEIPVILAEVIDHTSGLSFHGRLFEDILYSYIMTSELKSANRPSHGRWSSKSRPKYLGYTTPTGATFLRFGHDPSHNLIRIFEVFTI